MDGPSADEPRLVRVAVTPAHAEDGILTVRIELWPIDNVDHQRQVWPTDQHGNRRWLPIAILTDHIGHQPRHRGLHECAHMVIHETTMLESAEALQLSLAAHPQMWHSVPGAASGGSRLIISRGFRASPSTRFTVASADPDQPGPTHLYACAMYGWLAAAVKQHHVAPADHTDRAAFEVPLFAPPARLRIISGADGTCTLLNISSAEYGPSIEPLAGDRRYR